MRKITDLMDSVRFGSFHLMFGVAVLLFISASTTAYRRDHRFVGPQRILPSRAYTALLGTYATNGKYFGHVIERANSDGSKTSQIVLNNGQCMPLVGFGTWQLGNDSSAIKNTIKQALDAGYRLIDTAYIYDTEQGIGEALQEELASGKLNRQDMFITTKVWNTYFSKPKVLQSIRDSLRKLKLDYADLVLMHWPTGFKEGKDNYPKYKNGTIIPKTWQNDAYLETWEAFEEAVQLGLTRSIGVSNFNRNQMWKLLNKAKIQPVINQVESNPLLHQEPLRQFMMQNRVLLQAYAPIRRADKELLESPLLNRIGKPHRKSPAQVALRWQLDRSVPIVVKSSNPARMVTNLDLFDFSLMPNEISSIAGMEQKPRYYTIPGIESHPDYPFNEQ